MSTRNRIVDAIAASAIAAVALVACSPSNQVDSDVKVGGQATPSETFEQKATTPASSDEMAPAETAEM